MISDEHPFNYQEMVQLNLTNFPAIVTYRSQIIQTLMFPRRTRKLNQLYTVGNETSVRLNINTCLYPYIDI